MRRLIDPFDSLRPARRELTIGYGLLMAITLIGAVACLFSSGSWAVAAMFVPGLYRGRRKPYELLDIDRRAPSNWNDPLGYGVVWVVVAVFVLSATVSECLMHFTKTSVDGRGFRPDHCGLALFAVSLPALGVVAHLRRLSWLAAHRSYMVDVGSDGA